MADRIVKPDSGNDLVLQNDDGSGKIEINENASIPVTGTLDVSGATLTTSSAQKQAIVQAGPGSGTFDVSSGTFTTSSAQKQAIVQAGPGSGTLDVSSGTFTTSTAQKQAIVDGATIEAQDLASGSGTTLPNNVQDAITRLGTVTNGTLNSSVVFPTGHVIQTVASFDITSGTSYAPSTISMVINNVLANSKVFGMAWSGNYYPGTSGISYPDGYPTITGGGISGTGFFVVPASSRTFNLTFYDDSPGTGTNTYTLNTALGTSGTWAAAGGYTYGYLLMEIA